MPVPPRPRRRIVVIVLLLLAGFELAKTLRFRGPKHLDVTQLELRDLNGQPIPRAAFAGKAVLLNYWAPWCGPCRLEIPWMAAAQRAHPDDLLVIGVVDEPQDDQDALRFMRDNGVTYPVAQLSAPMLDAIGSMHTLPTTLYITRSGNVVHSVEGAVPKIVLDHWIDDTLARP